MWFNILPIEKVFFCRDWCWGRSLRGKENYWEHLMIALKKLKCTENIYQIYIKIIYFYFFQRPSFLHFLLILPSSLCSISLSSAPSPPAKHFLLSPSPLLTLLPSLLLLLLNLLSPYHTTLLPALYYNARSSYSSSPWTNATSSSLTEELIWGHWKTCREQCRMANNIKRDTKL